MNFKSSFRFYLSQFLFLWTALIVSTFGANLSPIDTNKHIPQSIAGTIFILNLFVAFTGIFVTILNCKVLKKKIYLFREI